VQTGDDIPGRVSRQTERIIDEVILLTSCGSRDVFEGMEQYLSSNDLTGLAVEWMGVGEAHQCTSDSGAILFDLFVDLHFMLQYFSISILFNIKVVLILEPEPELG